MLTPCRAISVNNIAKNTKVLSFFSQILIEAFPKIKFNKTFIISEKIRKNLKKVFYKPPDNSGNSPVTTTFYYTFGCIAEFATKLGKFCRKYTMGSYHLKPTHNPLN